MTTRACGLKLCFVLSLRKVGQWRIAVGAIAFACLTSACSSKLVIASFVCNEPQAAGAQASASIGADAGDVGDAGVSFASPWSTGFETGFCDYLAGGGFCYISGQGAARYQIVTSPVHAGKYAAQFTVVANKTDTNSRCVREGVLPEEAYYGAWYYIPHVATVPTSPDPSKNGLWNLFHFQVGEPGAEFNGIWDISLINDDHGGMGLVLYQFKGPAHHLDSIPIGAWFHLELFLKLASDNTGEVELFLNEASIYQQAGFVTSPYSSRFGQWYVGNLADTITPTESTLYVDDVSVGPTR